ncbi:putative secretory lipase [Diaporthe sp. PMI_573]|nr:putative secretory lipase [Diaporthaceae sp. PMI_573]
MLFATVVPALAVRASTESTFAKLNASTTCDDACKELVLRVSSWEADQRASDFSFYTVPRNYTADLAPGSVLRLEQTTNLTNYTVPAPLTMSRILYTTEDLNGTVIPASAYILWPSSPLEVPAANSSSNSTQWPIVAWAHGTSGGLSPCAPSNYRNLQYHFQVPFTLALQGYVVVAPDYAGLGVGRLPNGEEIGHPWAAWPAQANDIANAVTAARNAFPQFLDANGPFIAMGHSQGAASVWSFAERQVGRPVPGYKGALALAPPTGIIEQVRRAHADHTANRTQLWTNTYLSFQTPLIKAVTAAYPSLNLSGMTELGRDRWVNVQEAVQGCLPTKQVSGLGAPLAETAHRNWTEHPAVLEFEKRTAVGRRGFKGPLLIVAGDVDSITDINNLRETVNDTCEALGSSDSRESLQFVEYIGLNHFPVIQASQSNWLGWARERLFSSGVSETGCLMEVIKGFRGEDGVNTLFPNFSLDAAGAGNNWKYAL